MKRSQYRSTNDPFADHHFFSGSRFSVIIFSFDYNNLLLKIKAPFWRYQRTYSWSSLTFNFPLLTFKICILLFNYFNYDIMHKLLLEYCIWQTDRQAYSKHFDKHLKVINPELTQRPIRQNDNETPIVQRDEQPSFIATRFGDDSASVPDSVMSPVINEVDWGIGTVR